MRLARWKNCAAPIGIRFTRTFVRRGYTKEDAEDLPNPSLPGCLKRITSTVSAATKAISRLPPCRAQHLSRNEWDRANRQKRGGGGARLPLGLANADTRYQIDPADTLSPDKLYEPFVGGYLARTGHHAMRDESVRGEIQII